MKTPSTLTVKELKACLAKFKDDAKVSLGFDYPTGSEREENEIEGDTGVKCTLQVGKKVLLKDCCEM